MKLGVDSTFLYLKSGHIDGMGQYGLNLLREFKKEKNVKIVEYVNRAFRGQIDIDRVKKNGAYHSILPYLLSESFFNLFNFSLDEKQLDIDLFHSIDHRVPSFKKIPVVATIHDGVYFSNPNWIKTKFHKYKQQLMLNGAKRAKKIICVSNFSAKETIKWWGIDEKKIEVIYHGVDSKFFEILSKDNLNKILSKYGLKDKKYLLNISTLQPRKNHLNILKAFETLPKELKREFPLILVGGYGWGCEEAIAKIKELEAKDEVKWLKYLPQEDIYGLYQGSLTFIFPSLYEGFGFPIIEAFASKTPVITSNTTSLIEVAKKSAFLVNPNSINEISEAIKNLILNDSLRDEYINRGLNRVKEFSWEKSAKEHLRIFESLIK